MLFNISCFLKNTYNAFLKRSKKVISALSCSCNFCQSVKPFCPPVIKESPPGHEARPFQNAEAAFQACKFWSRAHEFSSLSGEEAFRKKKQLGAPDFTYGGFGSNWRAMRAVLETKFSGGSELAGLLLGTGAAFLLEHNEVS